MLDNSGAEIDPQIFRVENQHQFSNQLVSTFQVLEEANETIRQFEGQDDAALGRQWAHEIEESGDDQVKEAYESLIEHGGENLIHSLMGRISDDPGQEEITQEEYSRASKEKEGHAKLAIGLICGYKEFMSDGLLEAYGGEDDGTIEEEAWTATWKKLKEVLTEAEGTLLVEAVTLVDEIAQEHFGQDYDPQEHDRGSVVSANVCAKTFYKVLEPHLPRAIMRSGEDEWTGY